MGAPVVHFEIGSTDPAALAGFYRELFGWDIQTPPGMEPYAVVDTRSARGINGGIGPGEQNSVTCYAAVDDLDATLARIEELGGKIAVPPVTVPGVVTFAQFTDPQGHLFGLVRSDPDREVPPRTDAGGAPVTHFEITSPNPGPLFDFYGTLFGWEIDADNPMQYGLVHAQADGSTGGGIGRSVDGGSGGVTFYAEVPDLEARLERVVALGGSVVVPVTVIPEMVTYAMIADPQGHVIGLARSA